MDFLLKTKLNYNQLILGRMQTTRKNQPQNAANQVAFQDLNVQNGVSFQNVSQIFNGVDQDQGK